MTEWKPPKDEPLRGVKPFKLSPSRGPIDRQRARELLRWVWVGQHCLERHDAQQLAALERSGDSLFETCARLAGVDVSGVKAFDHEEVNRRLSASERIPVPGFVSTVRAHQQTAAAIASGKKP